MKIIGRSVLFKLSRGNTGLLSIRRIKVNEDLADEDVVAKSYPVGEYHRIKLAVTLLRFNWSAQNDRSVIICGRCRLKSLLLTLH